MLYETCEACGKAFVKYGNVPACKDCERDICPKCAAVYDPDPPGYLLCKECDRENKR